MALTPALTDFKAPTIFICYSRISVIANIEIKEKLFKGLKIISFIGEFSILAGPLEQDLIVVNFLQFSQKSSSKSAKNDEFQQILHQILVSFLWHLRPNVFWDQI